MSAANTANSNKEFVLVLILILASLFAGFNLPLPFRSIGALIIVFIPVPITIFCLRNGHVSGYVLLLAVLAIISVIQGPLYSVAILLEFGFLSLALAHGFRKGFSQGRIIFLTFAVNVGAAALLWGIITLNQGQNPKEFLAVETERQIQTLNRGYEQSQLSKEQLSALNEGSQQLKKLILLAYPGLYMSLALFIVLSNYLVSRRVLVKLDYMVTDRTPFSQVLIPDNWVWGLIGSILLLMSGIPKLNVLGLNATIFFSTIYVVQGIAISSFFWTKKHLNPVFKLLIAALMFINPLFLLLLFPLGLFDTWFDFRKLKLADGNA